tara:strand:+ start:60655 stop:61455 length:801 start_codon:yes stop_codon:yes gene_type:complete
MVILNAEQWLHKIRDIEIKYAIHILRNFIDMNNLQNGSILEIGSGDGYVIGKLSKEYPNLEFLGLEVEGSFYKNKSKIVLNYDGNNLTFLEKKFDLVFSLHVLEHIKDLDNHARQVKNILNPNGFWMNIVPSDTWRLFTTLNYYPSLFFKIFSLLNRYKTIKNKKNKKASKFNKSPFYFLIPHRHGERGNFITEFFYFKISQWSKILRKICLDNNMALIQSSKIPVFYCSRDLLRNFLNDKLRYRIANFFGGSSILLISKNQSTYF